MASGDEIFVLYRAPQKKNEQIQNHCQRRKAAQTFNVE